MNVPSLPTDKFLNEKGDMADSYRLFFDQLIKVMQSNLSNEGFVNPTQSNSGATSPPNKITLIQDNQLSNGQYTAGFGRCLYNSTANSIMFTINDLSPSNKPIFKTVTLT